MLATAAGWPWAWAALEGGLVWRRGRAMQSSGLEHALATYAAGGAAAVLLGTLALAAWGVELPGGAQLPCGPLEPLCAALTCMVRGVRDVRLDPGVRLPGAVAARCRLGQRQAARKRPPGPVWMRVAVAVTTVCWLVVLVTGLVLAFA